MKYKKLVIHGKRLWIEQLIKQLNNKKKGTIMSKELQEKKKLESDNQEDQYYSDVLSLDIKQIVIDAHNEMMTNAKQMDKQMEEDDAK